MATISRRHLPHVYVIGQPLFITFRLYGSLPHGRHFTNESLASGEAFVAMDRLLDTARRGPMFLRQHEIAAIVRSSILHCAQTDYDLHSWVVMPNHVHLLVTPHTNMSACMRRLKAYTAREANQVLGHSRRPFWQAESYDHAVRSGEEFRRIARYITNNPVKAGLVPSPEDFPWSSGGGSGDPPQA